MPNKTKRWSRTASLTAGLGLMMGCGSVAEEQASVEGSELGSVASPLSATASDIEIAQNFRPRLHFASSHQCWPLSFQELATTASSTERDAMENRCNSSYSSDFVVFASVKRPSSGDGSHWRNATYRVTYGVAFGWQENHLNSTQEWLVDLFADGDMGSHGEDAQYLVTDVVNGSLTSVWADLHKGAYARTLSQINLYNSTHVTAWAGKYYNSLKLITDKNPACNEGSIASELEAACYAECAVGSTCGIGDPAMNFGDPTGDTQQANGKLVMVEDVCATTGTSYTSPDGITYSGTRLEAMKAYLGCDGAAGAWSNSFRSKPQYSDPYALKGCKEGDTRGGNVCRASAFGKDDVWTTWSGSGRYLESAAVGNADVDYWAGTAFNDMLSVSERPGSITLRTGSRVDKVSVTYTDGTVKSHGGSGGSARPTLSGLDTDPVVSVILCEGSDNGRERAGYIKLTTKAGRTLEGGNGSSNCKTIAPTNMQLYGFYGRSGSEVDLLGTYWGPRPGRYTITASHSGKRLDIEGPSTSDNAQVHQWEALSGDSQKFTLTAAGGGYVNLVTYAGKCLDVAGTSIWNGAKLVQWPCSGGDNQKFAIISNGDGTHSFQVKHSGRCLGIAASGTTNGDDLIQWECSNIGDQKFTLTATN